MRYDYDPILQLAEDDCDRNDWDADWYDGEAEQLEALAAVIKNSSSGGDLNKGAYTHVTWRKERLLNITNIYHTPTLTRQKIW